MPDTNQTMPSLFFFTETLIPDYTNKVVDTGFAIEIITKALGNKDLSERDKQGLRCALARLSDALVDLSEDMEELRYDFNEQLKKHFNQSQPGGSDHG